MPGPTSNRRRPGVGSMLVHRLRRWPNIEPNRRSGSCLMPAMSLCIYYREETSVQGVIYPVFSQGRGPWSSIIVVKADCLESRGFRVRPHSSIQVSKKHMYFPCSLVKIQYCDREVGSSASDYQGWNFESCICYKVIGSVI